VAGHLDAVQGRRVSGTAPRDRRRGLLGVVLTLPGAAWLAVFFLVPLYVVVSISTGTVDPVFRSVVPAWNPADWRGDQFGYVLSRLTGPDGFFGPVMVRTVVYVLLAVAGCLVIAYPVAWFVARHSGRRRGLVLALIVAPFWISYMMRMLAWVNLLADDGLVNRMLGGAGLVADPVTFLSGRPTTVVLGLVYGYVPYMILPMYAALDRISPALLEAARDLGAGRFETFRRVVLPMSVPGVLAGLVLVALPMTGDYFTNDLLSASPSTAMLGNLINTSVANPSQAGQAGALVLILVLAMAAPMLLYVRSSVRSDLAS
jgi:ABC-type spermidine/putrescine transport system permease subunit I